LDKPVNFVIFASREEVHELQRTILFAFKSTPECSVIDVVINGNPLLAEGIYFFVSKTIQSRTKKTRIWNISVADKANAWNQHVHTIWPDGYDSIYVDGYVRVSKNAIVSLCSTCFDNVECLGTSAVPVVGRSSNILQRKMREEGGFHGNFCMIKAGAISEMRNRGITIPVGVYRVDSIMGAFLSFGLDNINKKWEPKRYIPVSLEASWDCDEKKWYRLKDIIAWRNRRFRQARGDIENAAFKYFMTKIKIKPEGLPKDIKSMVVSWSEACPEEAFNISNRNRLTREAMSYIRNYSPPLDRDCLPEELGV